MTVLKQSQLHSLWENDPILQALLAECEDAEHDYEQLAATLNLQQRQTIERYLSACEEVDHRKLTLALEL